MWEKRKSLEFDLSQQVVWFIRRSIISRHVQQYIILSVQYRVYRKICTWVYIFLPGCRAIMSCYADTFFYVWIFFNCNFMCEFFLTKLYHHFLCWHLLFSFFYLFPTIWVCEPSLLTGCWPKIVLVFKQTSETPWSSRQRQRHGPLIYLGSLMCSTNKTVIPLNSTFSIDAFCSVFLRTVDPLWFSKGKKFLPQIFELEGMFEVMESGIPSAFEDKDTGPECSGHVPQPTWYSVVDLSVNQGLLCPLPRHLVLRLETHDTRHNSSQDLCCGRQAWQSSVRHLAVNFSKYFKSLVLPGEVKEPLNVFPDFWLSCEYSILVSTDCLP